MGHTALLSIAADSLATDAPIGTDVPDQNFKRTPSPFRARTRFVRPASKPRLFPQQSLDNEPASVRPLSSPRLVTRTASVNHL